jgi:hypothetical protein
VDLETLSPLYVVLRARVVLIGVQRTILSVTVGRSIRLNCLVDANVTDYLRKIRLGAHREYKVELDQIYVEYEDALIGFYINEWF